MTNTNRPSSYTKRSYIQKAAIVNRRLRKGDITKVAGATGYSITHVSDVLRGNYFNTRIVNEAFDMTRGRQSNEYKLTTLSA
jgi:hypothetical protein